MGTTLATGAILQAIARSAKLTATNTASAAKSTKTLEFWPNFRNFMLRQGFNRDSGYFRRNPHICKRLGGFESESQKRSGI
ncbi:MAG TPA: hypothetical protein VJW55_12385, partial [Candidatus Angelobacter sp.]|nr:hypothetical protein [Candidatus Angelobacter sp.]